MVTFIRLALLLITPLIFVGAFDLWPVVIAENSLRYLAAVFSVVWAGMLWIFAKLADVSKVAGLAERERERLQEATKDIRHRLWWISGICLAGAVMLFFLSAASGSANAHLVAAGAGLIVGVALSYMVLVPVWHDELQAFIDRVREREERRKELEQAIKDLPGAA